MPTALITGTSTGIGEACGASLAAKGWTVYAGVRREPDGERLRAAHTGDIRPVILDVTKPDHVERVIDEVTMAVGDAGLQGLVNNAGVGVGGPSEYLEVEAWRTVFEANFFGVITLTRAAMPLLRRGRGRVVHIGSIGGRIATPGLAPYAASKHALEALAEASRLEFSLAGAPVRVSLVEPGAIATAIWDKADSSVDELVRRFENGEGPEYEWMIDEARGFVVEGRRNGIPPSRVADAVEHALTAPRPKARYLVGKDAKLAGHVIARLPEGHELRGKAAVANARLAYQLFRQRFAGERWEALAAKGARLQRPLWASTSTKNPDYSPTLYVDELIGPDTVNTLAPPSIDALRENGGSGLRANSIADDPEGAQRVIDALADAGVDFDDVTDTLEREGVASFADSYRDALATLERRTKELTA